MSQRLTRFLFSYKKKKKFNKRIKKKKEEIDSNRNSCVVDSTDIFEFRINV